MMKHTKKYIIILVVFVLMFFMPKVQAATARITASSSTAYVGDSVTITIRYTAAAWNLTVSGNGVSTKKYADVTSDAENATKTASVKLDTSKAGTYTVKLTGDITDGTTGNTSNVNTSVKVTVKEKPVETTKDTSTQNTTTSSEVSTKSEENTNTSNNNSQTKTNTSTSTSKSTTTTKTNKTEEKKTNTVEETKTQQTIEEQTEELPFGISELTIFAINENNEKEKIEIAPEFNINTFEYICNVKSNINKIEIEKNANGYDGHLEIIGLDEPLKDGENVIFLRMKKEDANVEYKIIVKKEISQVIEASQEEIQKNEMEKDILIPEKNEEENKVIKFLKEYGLWIGITAFLMGIEAGIFILLIKKRYVRK